MTTMVTREFTDNIDKEIQTAVSEVVEKYIPTLNDYLAELDTGDFEFECQNGLTIKFLPQHRVIAIIPLDVIGGYNWAFRTPNIEAEVDGTFENRLN